MAKKRCSYFRSKLVFIDNQIYYNIAGYLMAFFKDANKGYGILTHCYPIFKFKYWLWPIKLAGKLMANVAVAAIGI